MNKLELLIYNLVKTNPYLKRLIVETYQRLCSLVPVKDIESEYKIKVRKGFFYGFHDKCPWSADNTMILAHRFLGPEQIPEPKDYVEVGYFYGSDYLEFNPVGETRAWNWQMGAMLQWIGSTKNILFNNFDGDKHVARIVDISGKQTGTLERPVGAISPDGKKALSYNFIRFNKGLPGYGYYNGIDPDINNLAPSGSGSSLYIIDLQSLNSTELFSVKEIVGIEPHPSMKNSFHFFSHCLFSPSNERFVFLHRWLENENRLWTRMISCDLQGRDLFIFPTSGMVSHIGWRDSDHIIAYAQTEEFDDKYYLFHDRTGEFSIIGEHCFNSDGHPQYSPDRKYVLTDTYPDRFRQQYLIIYNVDEQKRYNIAKLRLPLKFMRELQCDLHPRWNRDGTMVCFDSAFLGQRALCTLQLGELKHV